MSPIPANRLRPALWGTGILSMLLIGGMALVQAFGSSSSSRTFVMFLVNVMLVVSIQAVHREQRHRVVRPRGVHGHRRLHDRAHDDP